MARIKEDYARFGLVPFLPGKPWAAHRQSKYGAALSPCMAEYAGKDLQGSSGDSFEMGKRIMLRCICAHVVCAVDDAAIISIPLTTRCVVVRMSVSGGGGIFKSDRFGRRLPTYPAEKVQLERSNTRDH